MANFQIDYRNLVVHIEPHQALAEEDFSSLESAIEPVLEHSGGLNGVIIEMDRFPGWDSAAALKRHLEFVHDAASPPSRRTLTPDATPPASHTVRQPMIGAHPERRHPTRPGWAAPVLVVPR